MDTHTRPGPRSTVSIRTPVCPVRPGAAIRDDIGAVVGSSIGVNVYPFCSGASPPLHDSRGRRLSNLTCAPGRKGQDLGAKDAWFLGTGEGGRPQTSLFFGLSVCHKPKEGSKTSVAFPPPGPTSHLVHGTVGVVGGRRHFVDGDTWVKYLLLPLHVSFFPGRTLVSAVYRFGLHRG